LKSQAFTSNIPLINNSPVDENRIHIFTKFNYQNEIRLKIVKSGVLPDLQGFQNPPPGTAEKTFIVREPAV
jgi:hypothetical protein